MPVTDTTELQGHWQAKVGKPGEVVQGDEAIEESLRGVLGTQKGELAYNPEFGVDWLSVLDEPAAVAVPHLVREAQEAVRRWLPDVKVSRLGVVGSGSHLTIRVYWSRRDEVSETMTEVVRA